MEVTMNDDTRDDGTRYNIIRDSLHMRVRGDELLATDIVESVDEPDTREKLEADVYRTADEMDRFYCGEKFLDTHKIIRWLDRQAAITRAELQGCPGYDAERHRCNYHANDFELTRERVCNLKREVSRLERELDSYDETHMPLPLDADGVPIRLHDKMEATDGMTFPVKSIHLTSEDWDDGSWWVNEARFDPKELHHHHERTVEDVLLDAGVSVAAVSDVAAEIRELMGGEGE